MKKLQIIRLKSAQEIIEKSKKALMYFKKNKKQCYLAYQYASKSYPAYDKIFFYPKLKPYILEERNIKLLIQEIWIKENKQINIQKEEESKILFHMFYEICAEDKKIWENTYGTQCPF